MQTYQTLADLSASKQTKSGTQLLCRENYGFYIVQDSDYVATPNDVTVSNGRVAKFEFIVSGANIKGTSGSVQDDIESIVAGGLPSQSGNNGKALTTNGSDAQWSTVGIEFSSTADMESATPTVDGTVAYNQERANAKYILAFDGYTAQPGDITAANGRVWELQDIFKVDCYGALANGSTDDTQAIQDCFDRVHAEAVYDQQFYGGVVEFGTGSYLITSNLLWRRFSIQGQGSFQTTLLWGGGDSEGMLNKEQANTFMRGMRLTTVGAGLSLSDIPLYYIDGEATSTKVDWAWSMYDVYFGKASEVAIRTGQPVNFYFERVRWDNAACLLEVNGEGFGSNNRVVSLKDCTADWTILTGVNVPVDCLFRFNLGNSDYYTFNIENWRFEGSNTEFSGNSIIQLNDKDSPSQELRTRPLSLVIRNVGFSADNHGVKRLDLIEINTASFNVNIPITFDNFYQNGQLSDIFTPASVASLSSLQTNTSLPLTMGFWCMWPAVGGDSDVPLKVGPKVDIGEVELISDGSNLYAKSIVTGSPDSESNILTISGGAIDVSGVSGLVSVDTESSAATDDLENITGGVGNQRITIHTPNNSRDITIKDGTGNIILGNTGADRTLSTRVETINLVYSEQIGVWLEV